MKTKIITALLLTALLIPLILAGCTNDSEPNFGATGAKSYEPSLSAMSDEAIRVKIDELYDKMDELYDKMDDWTTGTAKQALYTDMIKILQFELYLRQLEALNTAEADKQPIQPHGKFSLKGLEHKKGLKELQGKQGLKGFGKNTLKGGKCPNAGTQP